MTDKYPTTVEELEAALWGTESADKFSYGLFWRVRGLPQRYFILNTPDGRGSLCYEYSVLGLFCDKPLVEATPLLCRELYRYLKGKQYQALSIRGVSLSEDKHGNGPTPPIMLVRREVELSTDLEEERSKLTIRICLPGADLSDFGSLDAGEQRVRSLKVGESRPVD